MSKQPSQYQVPSSLSAAPVKAHKSNVLAAAKFYGASYRKSLYFTLTVWTALGYYGYVVWTDEKPKTAKENDAQFSDNSASAIMETASTNDVEKREKEETPKKKTFYEKMTTPILPQPEILCLKLSKEELAKYCVSNNPSIVLNEKEENSLERFELETRGRFVNRYRLLPLSKVMRDENGEFVFDEDGYPVKVLNTFEQFLIKDWKYTTSMFKKFRDGVLSLVGLGR